MEFIKCYWSFLLPGFRVSIRTNYYSRSLDHVQKMVDELKKDHPEQEVKPDDVAVVIYNTPSFKGIMGVEWNTEKPNKKYCKEDIAPCIF